MDQGELFPRDVTAELSAPPSVSGAPDVQRARRAERKELKRRAKRATTDAARTPTGDSYQNFVTSVGIGTNNDSSYGGYGFNPVTRNHVELEWLYRGSWIAQVAVDYLADDTMARGIDLGSTLRPEAGERLIRRLHQSGNWDKLRLTHKWGRLYGGALAVIQVDGQDYATPLRIDRIAPHQFKGLVVLDRWMVNASVGELVEDPGDDFGTPKYYDVQVVIPGLGNARIHHSRCLRIDGIELPYWQKVAENYWSMSVVEPLWDRLLGFDSTTLNAGQLVNRAYLRNWKVKGLRAILGENDVAKNALLENALWMRKFQNTEGLSLIDSEDEIEALTYSFGGLAEVMQQFAQQLSGALGIPLVRLFGQSPSGFSTGETDIQNYDDNVAHHQQTRVRHPLDKLLRVQARSEGIALPSEFWWTFKPFRLMDENQKAEVATKVTTAVTEALDRGAISPQIAARELKQQSGATGIFTNITDEFVEKLEDEPPPVGEGTPGIGSGEGEEGFPGGDFPPPARGNGNAPGREVSEADAASDRPRSPRHLHLHVGDASRPREIVYAGHPVYIETFRGEERRGLRGWVTKMPADYGYIRGTGSAEGGGEALDCYLGPDEGAGTVYVVDQVDPASGAFDEHKVMLGYPSRVLALRDYQRAFNDGSGAARVGGVKAFSRAQFAEWLVSGDVTAPAGRRTAA